MKPIAQTRVGNSVDAPGNCFSAAVASVMDVPLETLPDEVETIQQLKKAGKWSKFDRINRNRSWEALWNATQDWLASRYGLRMVEVKFEGKPSLGGLVVIASGPSPRGLEHCVVLIDGKMVHDPHPEGGGIDETKCTYILFAKMPHPRKNT